MGPVQLDQSVHLGRDVLWWTVGVHRAVRARRVVGPFLVFAPNERHACPVAGVVATLGEGLVVRKQSMQLLDIARGE